MKKILTFLCLLQLSSLAFSQNSWTQKGNFPGGVRYGTAYLVIDDKAYVGLGKNGTTTFSDWWQYDPTSDSWTAKTNFPGGLRFGAAAVSINGKGYVGLGTTPSFEMKNDWWEYDPIADSWTQKSSLPSAGRYSPATFVLNGEGYICGGNLGAANGPFTSQLWQYDPLSNNWSAKTKFPGSPRYGSIAFSIDDKGYAGLGARINRMGSYGYFKDFYQYDPITDSWSQMANYPSSRTYGTSFVLDGIAYVGLGQKNGVYYTSFYSYNSQTNSWHAATNFPGTGRFIPFGFSINGQGYIGTGFNSTLNTYYTDVWNFGPPQRLSESSTNTVSQDCPVDFTTFNNQLLPHFIQGNDFTSVQMKLFDLTGRLIRTQLITDDSPILLDSNLPRGIYLVVLSTGNQNICTQKISIW